MGEARRRKQAAELNPPIGSDDRWDAINKAIREIHHTGNGAMEVWWYTAELMLDHLQTRQNEDTLANASCINQFQRQIIRDGADCLCLLCDKETFHTANLPRVIVILRPSVEALATINRSSMLVVCNGICWDCAGSLDTADAYGAIGARVFEYCSNNLRTEVRLINPTAGHA